MSIKLILFLGFAAAAIFAIDLAAAKKIAAVLTPATAPTGCPLPQPGQTLVAYGSADGKPVCEYHPTRHYGQAK